MKKKILISVFIIILAVILITSGLFIGIKMGKEEAKTKSEKSEPYYTYMAYYIDSTDDEELLNTRVLFTFEDNKCVNCRASWEFSTEESAKENYNKWSNVEENKNLKINSTIVSFDMTQYIGKNIEEALQEDFENQNYKYKIEIF